MPSESNLVCNGSFEANNIADGNSQFFSDQQVPGWNSLRGLVCLVDNRDGVVAAEGSIYAELDCANDNLVEGLFQDVPTEVGQVYNLSFMMRARDPSRAGTEDEGINVSVQDEIPLPRFVC